jgi:hypothetical protein
VAIVAADPDGAPVILIEGSEDFLAEVLPNEGLAGAAAVRAVMAGMKSSLPMG